MKNRLKEKVIIITGGSGLLGNAMIKRLSYEGAICLNFDIDHKNNHNLTNVNCDITNKNSIDKALKKVLTKYPIIHGLVNNAYPRTSDWSNIFENISLESWKKNIDWQLNSHFYITQKVADLMSKQSQGSIVNIASIYGMVGPDFSVYNDTNMTMPAAYSAIKGAVINFTRYLSSYLGPKQVRVNTISPGGIFDNQDKIFINNYCEKVPLRRMGLPEDIASSTAFLLSDDSGYITGHNLVVDGGWTAK